MTPRTVALLKRFIHAEGARVKDLASGPYQERLARATAWLDGDQADSPDPVTVELFETALALTRNLYGTVPGRRGNDSIAEQVWHDETLDLRNAARDLGEDSLRRLCETYTDAFTESEQ